MQTRPESHLPRWKARRGFSLLETTISTMLMGIVMAGALHAVGAAQRRERDATDRVLGQQLAGALLNEILLQAYQEPDPAATTVFGTEAGEATGKRALFDDVDDYAGWTQSPPQDRNGNQLSNLAGWTRSVSVGWANPDSLNVTGANNTGLKKITVTVSRRGQTWGSIVGYRSIAWDDTVPKASQATSNHSPVAVVTSTNLSRKLGQAVSLDGSRSSDADGDALSLIWSFGDGTAATGASVSHTYTSAGSFTCTLTVSDGRGGTSTSSLTAMISP